VVVRGLWRFAADGTISAQYLIKIKPRKAERVLLLAAARGMFG
jgi:hypothetical protein